MTLIKKSDVHRHLSTKSRERREKTHPYKPEVHSEEINKAVGTPVDAATGDAAGVLPPTPQID